MDRESSDSISAEPGNTSSWTEPDYSEENATRYLQFTRVSFCTESSIRGWTCGDMCEAASDEKPHVSIIGPGESFGVQGYVARDPSSSGDCILAFRGSVNMKNWATDAKMWTKPWPSHNVSWCRDCEVHAGFVGAYEELRVELQDAIGRHECKRLTVAGHSLGAAIATVATMDLRGNGKGVAALWTFGSPRVGNLAFAKAFVAAAQKDGVEVPSWRVVHYHDPVPQGGPSHAYTHVPVEVYYGTHEFTGNSSDYTLCPWRPDSPEDTSCGAGQVHYGDIVGGLLTNDHVLYLNQTLATKDMNFHCLPENICKGKGYVHNGFSLVSLMLVATWAAAASFVLGVVCERRRRRGTIVPSTQPEIELSSMFKRL